MPTGVYERTLAYKAAMSLSCAGCGGHLASNINQERAAVARKLSRPRQHGYAALGKNGVKLAHRVRAEIALGRPLPVSAVVHHADGSKSVDAPLVICPNDAYHALLHVRMRVQAAGGDPNLEKICSRCKLVKAKTEFNVNRMHISDGLDYFCRQCVKEKNAIQKGKPKAGRGL